MKKREIALAVAAAMLYIAWQRKRSVAAPAPAPVTPVNQTGTALSTMRLLYGGDFSY